tara:strand:- start:552 stop:896 length:345 start_codon:yes stop_codon:yes gene_type:complete
MKDHKFWKTCIGGGCLAGSIFILFIIINGMVKGEQHDTQTIIEETLPTDTVFVPTAEDHAALDTMLTQVQDIEIDIDTLHVRIDRIEDKIDALIEEQSDEYRMWITQEGDTIWD